MSSMDGATMPAAGTAVNGGMAATGGVGARLRAAREAQGLTPEALSKATRISVRHIQAIESEDWAGLPPGRPYALGFARSYARAVGLEPEMIAQDVRRALETGTTREPMRTVDQFDLSDPAKTPTRRLVWLSTLAAVLLVVGGLSFWQRYYAPAGELPALAPPAAPARPATQPAAAPAAVPANAPVVFTALEDQVWVKFYDGAGKQLMQKQMARGETYTVPTEAQDPKVWTGRPDALTVTVGGKSLGRLAEKQMTMKDVAVNGAALLARPPAPALSPGGADPQAGQGEPGAASSGQAHT